MFLAWCLPRGDAYVTRAEEMPEGAVPLCRSRSRKRLEAMLGVACRHGKGASEGTLLVPGLPEAGCEQRLEDGSFVFVEDPTPQQVAAGRLKAVVEFVAWRRQKAEPGLEYPQGYVTQPVAFWDTPPADPPEEHYEVDHEVYDKGIVAFATPRGKKHH